MQIGLALHNYEMARECLPPGTVDPNRPIKNQALGYHVGWVVQVLPYLDQTNVYKNFDFLGGVYSPTNNGPRGVGINVLNCPTNPTPKLNGSIGVTTYAGIHHHVEAPIDIDNTGVLFLNSNIRYRDVTDGVTNTIFVAELSDVDPLGWASGTRATLRNGRITGRTTTATITGVVAAGENNEERLLQVGGISSNHAGGLHILMGDGSVRFLSESIGQPILENLANRKDGSLPVDF
jgi:prepilin-type processing-associated H-X9-DG protein